MKKITVLTIALGVMCSSLAFAQDIAGRFAIGGNVYYAKIADYTESGGDINFDASALFDANLTYYINKIFSVQLDIGYHNTTAQHSL